MILSYVHHRVIISSRIAEANQILVSKRDEIGLGAKCRRLELGEIPRYFHTSSFAWRQRRSDQGERPNKINLSFETKWTLEEQLCGGDDVRKEWLDLHQTNEMQLWWRSRDLVTSFSTARLHFSSRWAHWSASSFHIQEILWKTHHSSSRSSAPCQWFILDRLVSAVNCSIRWIWLRRLNRFSSPNFSFREDSFLHHDDPFPIIPDQSLFIGFVETNSISASDDRDKARVTRIDLEENFFLVFQGKCNESWFLSFFKTMISTPTFSHQSVDTNQRSAAAASCDLRGEETDVSDIPASPSRSRA